ncbi:hypothetical protein, partial [Microcoleus sp. D3_18_C4]|uniref:hypothetical protein n=1 Tax=Microcoleus sp. D3_18_C4 TaxID=3055335 RepID=UPI002FD35B3B
LILSTLKTGLQAAATVLHKPGIPCKLRAGTSYKACLVADNIGRGFEGRRIQCYNFVARDEQTIRFSLNQLQYVGDP